MNKKLLSLLIVSLFAISLVGVVSAEDIEIIIYMEGDIVSPLDGSHVKGNINVEWENSGSPGFYLQYTEGTCVSQGDVHDLTGPMPSSQESYSWHTTDVIDGDYCLRLQLNKITYGSINLTVDNTDPKINNFAVNYDGKESDRPPVNPATKSEVYVHASDDNMDFCEIKWDDGVITNCFSNPTKAYKHQYEDSLSYTVKLTVKDKAGNVVSKTVNVNPLNVAPTITANITAPNNFDVDGNGLKEAAVGEVVKFTASGSDVNADLKDGLTCTWTFDGANPEPTTTDELGNCEVYYTWDSARVHTVDLIITDKDGGSVDADQFELEVEQPEHMTPMQQVVANEVFKFELDETWAVNNQYRFKTSFSNLVICDEVVVPNGMTLTPKGNNKCQVDWNPSNEQRGEHLVIIKVQDTVTNEIKYYSFDVTVYSWGIPLEEGWNLISIPYVPTDSNIDKVFADIIDNVAYVDANTATVLQYDAVTSKWYKATPNKQTNPTGFTGINSYKLTNVVPGYGYWVKMNNADTIYGIEENFNPGISPVPSVQLAGAKWNLIGRYGTGDFGVSPVNLDEAFETLEGNWFSNGFLKFDGISSFQKATSIDVGNGYWLRTKILPNGQTSIAYEPLSYYFD